jgi:hypothetical protein
MVEAEVEVRSEKVGLEYETVKVDHDLGYALHFVEVEVLLE